MSIQPVILSGGSGTRLWPLSRRDRPKQFLTVSGPESLLVQTARRLDGHADFEPPIFICNDAHRFLVAESLREAGLKAGPIVLEPCARNTAPAAVAATLVAQEHTPDPLILLLPSDHLISDDAAFLKAIEDAAPAARAGYFVCFGVAPTRAETGFGYIAAGPRLGEAGSCRAVTRFVEKPDGETAAQLVSDGGHLWNAGLFLFSGARLLEALEAMEPDLVARCREAVAGAGRDLDFLRLEAAAFAAAKEISIDHALMERTDKAAVADAAFGWSDLGSYPALWEASTKDHGANAVVGDVVTARSRDNFLYSEGQLLAAIDVAGLSVVATQDAVLVAPLNDSAAIGELVASLRKNGRGEADTHATVYRPWGRYRTIVEGPRYRVKEIAVQPGRRLSRQFHEQRAEHWVVVEGTAEIRRGEDTILLEADQSHYIPAGAVHRLAGPGQTPLRIIEVQTGSHLSEQDIVRLDDDYGRLTPDDAG